MHRCPVCNGSKGKFEQWVGYYGRHYVECFLCSGEGSLPKEKVEEYNRKMDHIKNHTFPNKKIEEEQGDVLYGPNEKWRPI